MFNFSQFLTGIFMVAAGVAVVKYTFQLVNITGRQDWIERYTGSGTTYLIFKIFGVLVIIAGVLFATGMGSNLLDFLFSPLKQIFQPVSR